MGDLQSGMATRSNELINTLMPENQARGGDEDFRAKLREFVIAPEEVLLLPVAPVMPEPSGSTEGADLQKRLKQEITIALGTISNQEVKEIAQTILLEIKAVFSRLSLVESNLRKLDTLQENLSILEMLQFDTHSLVQFIEAEAMRSDWVSDKLHDVLDGMSYGISHDVKRIFEQGILGNITNQTTPVVYGKILHAHGLLTNCFQQSVITLLQVFNPSLDPLLLFDDFEQRLRQSLSLCRDLSSVMRVVHNAQLDPSPDNQRAVVNSVMDFRDGSMQYLMYRDWRGYERLALELITAIEHNSDTKDLLHQFSCYLDVLYGHVKMRAVLRDMFAGSSEEVQL